VSEKLWRRVIRVKRKENDKDPFDQPDLHELEEELGNY